MCIFSKKELQAQGERIYGEIFIKYQIIMCRWEVEKNGMDRWGRVVALLTSANFLFCVGGPSCWFRVNGE